MCECVCVSPLFSWPLFVKYNSFLKTSFVFLSVSISHPFVQVDYSFEISIVVIVHQQRMLKCYLYNKSVYINNALHLKSFKKVVVFDNISKTKAGCRYLLCIRYFSICSVMLMKLISIEIERTASNPLASICCSVEILFLCLNTRLNCVYCFVLVSCFGKTCI